MPRRKTTYTPAQEYVIDGLLNPKPRKGPKSNIQKEWEARLQEKVNALSDKEEEALIKNELARRYAKRDLQFLMTDVLGYPKTDEVHKEIEQFINGIVAEKGKHRGLLLIPRGHLKAQPLTSKVMTINGWKNIGELSVGDKIIGSDGKETTLTQLHPISRMKIFEIETRDGRKVRCNDEHLWSVYCPSNTYEKLITVPLKEMIPRYKKPKFDKRDGTTNEECRYFLPLVKGIELKEKKFEIDPYLLGVWLGDGTTAAGSITLLPDDYEILPRAWKGEIRKTKALYRYSLIGFQALLRKHSLLGNKHVPIEYFLGSFKQRLELLRGLLDTDGTVQMNNKIASFTNKNKGLVEAVIYLVRSLGGIAKLGRTVNHQFGRPIEYWSTTIMLPKEVNPFYLRRKADRWEGSRSLRTAIVSIKEIGEQDARCITVANSDGLYVTDDFTLTHNSTLVTVCWTIQQIIKNPNIRILISNGYLENSKGFLREIKSHFEKNERFRILFGDLTNADDKWTETQIVVKARTEIRKEPTIQVASVDKSVVSQHYDLIICDDLVNRENINTREQRRRLLLYYKDLFDLIEPNGSMVFIGTRWHFDDLYGYLIRENEMSKNFDVFLRTVWRDEAAQVPLFPLKFTPEYIGELKRDKGTYEFSAQYMNNPVDDEDADFKREWIRTEPLFKLEAVPLGVYITIDPAMTKSGDSDYTGIVVNGVDPAGSWRLLRAYKKRMDPAELVDEIFFLYSLYRSNFRRMGIEKTMYTVGLRQSIDNEMIRKKRFFDIVEVEHKQRTKETRIRALVPRFESGRVVMSEYCQDLIEEMLSFPRGEHDDVLDALAYQLFLADDAQPVKLGEIAGDIIRVLKPKFQKY